jgi:hypothetical protein
VNRSTRYRCKAERCLAAESVTRSAPRLVLILRSVIALVLSMNALMTTGCATSAVCARKPPYRQVRGAIREIALFTNAASNQWMAIIRCDTSTPDGIQALTTNGCLVLSAYDNGNSAIARRVVEVLRGQPCTAEISFGACGDKWLMTVFGKRIGPNSDTDSESISWRSVGTDSDVIGGNIVCNIPKAAIAYSYRALASRPVFYAEQVVLFPLALCADIVTSPFQIAIKVVEGQMKKMWP